MVNTNPLRYTIAADVDRRLRNTFVKYKGKAFYVAACSADLTVAGWHLSDSDWTNGEPPLVVVHSSDTNLDLESPALGWANTQWNRQIRPLFFMRTIHRQFQQGISPGRVQFLDPMNPDDTIQLGYRFGTVAGLIPFSKMIDGVGYPTLETAIATKQGASFDRHWALVPPSLEKGPYNMLRVYHDGIVVGVYSKSDASFFFARKMLTKTRRASLEVILEAPENNKVYHGIQEQT